MEQTPQSTSLSADKREVTCLCLSSVHGQKDSETPRSNPLESMISTTHGFLLKFTFCFLWLYVFSVPEGHKGSVVRLGHTL